MSLEIEICYSVGLLEANNLNLPRWKDHVVYNVDSCGDSFRRELNWSCVGIGLVLESYIYNFMKTKYGQIFYRN